MCSELTNFFLCQGFVLYNLPSRVVDSGVPNCCGFAIIMLLLQGAALFLEILGVIKTSLIINV
jgi:hypothetical protein